MLAGRLQVFQRYSGKPDEGKRSAQAADPNQSESKKTAGFLALMLGQDLRKGAFLYPQSCLGCQNTHSLSMTRHSTPFSSARILADRTSSLEAELLCYHTPELADSFICKSCVQQKPPLGMVCDL